MLKVQLLLLIAVLLLSVSYYKHTNELKNIIQDKNLEFGSKIFSIIVFLISGGLVIVNVIE